MKWSPKFMRKLFIDESHNLELLSKDSYAIKTNWFASAKKSVPIFLYNFSMPSSLLRVTMFNSITTSLAFPSRDQSTVGVCLGNSNLVASSFSSKYRTFLCLKQVGKWILKPFWWFYPCKMQIRKLLQKVYWEKEFICSPLNSNFPYHWRALKGYNLWGETICKQLYFQITILNTNILYKVIWF